MKAKIENAKRLNIPGNGDLLSNREILTGVLKSWLKKLGYYSMFTALPAILTTLSHEAQAEETKKPELLSLQSNYLLPRQKSKNNIISDLTGGDNCPGTAIPGGIYTSATPYTDAGNTTGANNTVASICGSYCYSYSSTPGPDQIYTFRITGIGSNPQIQVSATSANYDPAIYILYENQINIPCPNGTNNTGYNHMWWFYSPSPGGTETIHLNLHPFYFNVPLYLFVDSAVSGAPNDSGSYTLRIQDMTIAPAAPPRTRFDFDGDSKSDIAVFRPSDGVWYLNRSSEGFYARQFGLSTDKLTPADFDGDGRTDIAVFRDGTWYWLTSSNGTMNVVQFGLPDDIPVPSDYTGDGRAELAVYRNGTWWLLNFAINQVNTNQFGLPTDKPVPADYDGDGRADQAVYRNGEWHLNRSSQGYAIAQFGLSTDQSVIGDYDGDGKTDLAVYRDGTWYLLQSSQGFTAFQWGLATDIPAPADYDGDGKTDAAIFRDGVWWLRQSTNGVSVQQFGLANDKPVPAVFLP